MLTSSSAYSLGLRLYDDDLEHRLTTDSSDGQLSYVESRRHGAGVCPVVHYVNELDLDGRYFGEVEPLIPMQDRLNQTVLDLLMTESFGSWKIRTVAEEGPASPQ